MTVIKLPKTPKSAFNPGRPAGALLLAQIEHLEHAVGLEPKRVRRSEGQAAKYIAQLTAELLKRSQQTTAPAPSVTAPQPSHPIVAVGTKAVGTRKHAAPAAKPSARKAAKRGVRKKTVAARRRTR
jgi:hypothetical protein